MRALARTTVLERVGSSRAILLVAPPGFAKTTTARQIADAIDGCTVIDDADASGRRRLIHAAFDRVRADAHARVIVCSGRPLPELDECSDGLPTLVLGAEDLRFTPTQTQELVGTPGAFDLTGGWPLAVGLAAANLRLGACEPIDPADATALTESVLAGAPEDTRRRLGLLARTTRLPLRLLGPDAPPALVVPDAEGMGRVPGFAKTPLRRARLPLARPAELAAELTAAGEPALGVYVLAEAGDWPAAHAGFAAATHDLLERNAWQALLDLVEAFPPQHQHALHRLAAASARVATWSLEDDDLHELAATMWAPGPMPGLWAASLHAFSLFYRGDPRAPGIALDALGRACGSEATEEAVQRLLRTEPREVVRHVAFLVEIWVYHLLWSHDPAQRALAGRLHAAVLAVAEERDFDTAAGEAMYAYFDATTGGRSLAAGITAMRDARVAIDDLGSRFREPVLLALADLELRAGNFAHARTTAEAIRVGSDHTGSTFFNTMARFVDTAARLLQGRQDAAIRTRLDALYREALEMNPHALRMCAATIADGLLDGRDVETARKWVSRATVGAGPDIRRAFGLDILEARFALLADADPEAGARLQSLAQRAEAAGLQPFAEHIRSRLARDRDSTGTLRSTSGPSDTLMIGVLGPQIRIIRPSTETAAPKGRPARLLALLVARDGRVPVPHALGELWADDDDARAQQKRLHGVLHRLRRNLGLDVDGPLRLEGGDVRLDRHPRIDVDAWHFEDRLRRTDSADVHALREACELYVDDFCARQFAYEEFALEYRRALRKLFVDAARACVPAAIEQGRSASAVRLARRLWERAIDDEDAAFLAVQACTTAGLLAEARDMRDATAAALADIGIPTDEFLARTDAVLEQAR